MSDFKSTSKLEGDTLLLTFEGGIDEDSQFPSVDTARCTKMSIDLHAVKSINSVGIREWLDWIRPLSEKVAITLTRCPKPLVFQFNMVEGFLPAKATVTSFYVPFFCEDCDREDNILFNVGQEVVANGGALTFNFDPAKQALCSECKKPMEMDVTESKYFQFLKRM